MQLKALEEEVGFLRDDLRSRDMEIGTLAQNVLELSEEKNLSSQEVDRLNLEIARLSDKQDEETGTSTTWI